MAKNELVLLDKVLEQRQEERDTPLPADQAFELFASEQLLRDMDVSGDEVMEGVVGGAKDGGLDSIFAFLGENLLAEDSELFSDGFQTSRVAPGTRILLWLIQAKREEGFSETAIDKVASSATRLLDLAKSDEDLLSLYSERVVSRVGTFRHAIQILAGRHPSIEVRFSYVTRGSTSSIDPKVQQKASDLETQFSSVMSEAIGVVEFLGATELWSRASSLPSYTLQLSFQENATSGTSHIGLVSLRDYLVFLTDETGKLRRHIFDWNVRDYEGGVEVNQEIEKSLEDNASPEFWWLNNGVTIICSKTSIVGKTYVFDDVQIVNGLQTSHTIFQTLHAADPSDPALTRSLLVRVLVTDDPTTRDRVIRATNRQTTVPQASLRATDQIQRAIEAFFLSAGWFYDRRKNYYRNLGKTPDRIVGIPLLAQAVMAMGLSEPHNSRARPSSLLKRDEDYERIFSSNVDLAIYLWVAKSQRAIDSFLLTAEATTTAPERINLRFHLATMAVSRLHDGKVHAPSQLRDVAVNEIPVSDADLPARLDELRSMYATFSKETGSSMDKIAKGRDFAEYILKPGFP